VMVAVSGSVADISVNGCTDGSSSPQADIIGSIIAIISITQIILIFTIIPSFRWH